LFLEELAEQSERRSLVAPALNQHVENLASWSTARHRDIRWPAMRTTISSRCHRSLGRGRDRRSLWANPGPNLKTQRRTVS